MGNCGEAYYWAYLTLTRAGIDRISFEKAKTFKSMDIPVTLEKPELSVLIFAHDRKAYLKKAIESVLDQTLDRTKYEIIVVKNFRDIEIDALMAKEKVTSVFAENTNYGDDIMTSVKLSSAEIVCFLEDDDYYCRDKLETVLDEFQRNPKLGYYHHSEFVIDSEGKVLSHQKVREDYTVDLKFNIFSMSSGLLREYILSRGNGNPSMMAIRKSVLAGLSEFIKNFKSPEYFISFAALISGLDVHVNSRKLTYYRVHSSESLKFWNDEESFIKWFLASNVTMYNVFTRILDMVKGTKLQNMAIMERSAYKVLIYIFGGGETFKPTKRDIALFLKSKSFHNRMPNAIPAVILSALWILFPKRAYRFYFKRHRKMASTMIS